MQSQQMKSYTRNSNGAIHFQEQPQKGNILASPEGQSVIMFTDYPDFLNAGSPDAQQGFIERIQPAKPFYIGIFSNILYF